MHYENLDALKNGKAKEQLDLPHRLVEECCEGTPSFENFDRWDGNLKTSKFTMRYHYLYRPNTTEREHD